MDRAQIAPYESHFRISLALARKQALAQGRLGVGKLVESETESAVVA